MDRIQAGHGSGGKLMNDMINNLIRKIFGEASVQPDDSAVLDLTSPKIAFTTDTFVITPVFFPGGDIGTLAVNGTVNDLAVMGAEPKYISCGLILEEGLPMDELKRVLESMKREADSAGVEIVTGDTKVVPAGKADKIFINTAGIGVFNDRLQRRPIEKGDAIIISGTIGDHGVAIMAERNELSFSKGLSSDCAHLNHMIAAVCQAFPEAVKFMRDATRGGVASVLNEIVEGTDFSAGLVENDLPLKDEVEGMCDILGLDPLYVANEGKVLMIVEGSKGKAVVEEMRKHAEGKDAAIIGSVTDDYPGKAFVETPIGGKRLLPLQLEEQLPRIC